jgi:hypothetical protein
MTYGGSAYGGSAVGSTGSATTFESAALSAGAQATSAETASAAEAGTGASLSFAIGAERKVLRDNGALVATTAPTATEGTAGIEQGAGASVASPAVTGTGRVDLTGTATVTATTAITATGRKGEAGAATTTADSRAIEKFAKPEAGIALSVSSVTASETFGFQESARADSSALSLSTETASGAEAATGASLSFAIGAERKVLRDNGALTANVSPAVAELGVLLEAGDASIDGISFATDIARAQDSASVNAITQSTTDEKALAVENGTTSIQPTVDVEEAIQVFDSASVLTAAAATVTEAITETRVKVADVEKYAALGWQQLEPEVKNTMLLTAQALIENQFTDRTSTLPTLVGDKDDATELLAAHLFDLAEGGEAQSEGGEAGNVTYNTTAGETLNSLTETRFGRLFADVYLRDRMGIGVVRSR